MTRFTSRLALTLFALTAAPRLVYADTHLTYDEAVAQARAHAPDVRVAQQRELVAQSEIGVAGVVPNPTLTFGTNTQVAKLAVTASVPLLILGQRGAAMDASRADLVTVKVDNEGAWLDIRANTQRAYVALWQAEQIAHEKEIAAQLARRVDDMVAGRVDVGAAPELDKLRAHAERLRADAESVEAALLIRAASSELARWTGEPDFDVLRTRGEPFVPSDMPPLASWLARIAATPWVRREEADARASEARAGRERALVRPTLTIDLGADIYDPTLPTTNYRAALGLDIPLFNRRGSSIERETRAAALARSRRGVAETQLTSQVVSAYRVLEALNGRTTALQTGVVPAAEAAARATEEAYRLGRSPLVAVLDALRAKVDAVLALREVQAARARTWIDLQRMTGAS